MVNHITHIEDLVLEQGSVGGMKTQNILWSIQAGAAQISTKWDGCPSIFAGWDDDGFFVSTKSYLNKIPVTYRTPEDLLIIENENLRLKMKYCLAYLKDVVPKSMVVQGDLMWTPGDITWDGEYAMFHPNTIVYGIPDRWFTPKWMVGVVWHNWISKTGDVSQPRFGRLLTTKSVFCIDPIIPSYTIEEDIVTGPRDAFARIHMGWLDTFSANKHLVEYTKRFQNKLVRESAEPMDFTNSMLWRDGIIKFKMAEITKLKTKNAKERHLAIGDEMYAILNNPNLMELLDFMESVRVAKRNIINSLEQHSKFKTWVKTDNGLVSAAHEGYVVIGQSETLKIVDRQQFSRMNFDPAILKGWNAPTRN